MFDSFLLTSLKATNYPFYVAWRAVLHVACSLVVIGGSHILGLMYGHDVPRYTFIVLVIVITYVEFYLHPKIYHQKLLKGIVDWCSWIVPFVLYFLFV